MIERLSSKTFAILILIIFFISFALYHSSLNYYFFQDDFFEINISKAQNLGQYLEFFKFRDDIIAYRPISLQNYFFLSLKIFGFDPSGFRVLTFALLFSSAILLIVLVKKITGNIWIGFLSAFFWLTSSIHFMAITWIAAAYNITGTFLCFIFNCFSNYNWLVRIFSNLAGYFRILLFFSSWKFSHEIP